MTDSYVDVNVGKKTLTDTTKTHPTQFVGSSAAHSIAPHPTRRFGGLARLARACAVLVEYRTGHCQQRFHWRLTGCMPSVGQAEPLGDCTLAVWSD
eukprot:4979689-Pleurochrysis_carterae.AAC.9